MQSEFHSKFVIYYFCIHICNYSFDLNDCEFYIKLAYYRRVIQFSKVNENVSKKLRKKKEHTCCHFERLISKHSEFMRVRKYLFTYWHALTFKYQVFSFLQFHSKDLKKKKNNLFLLLYFFINAVYLYVAYYVKHFAQ